jgi:hypothetical protein
MWPSCVGRTLVMSVAVWIAFCSASGAELGNEWFGSRPAVQTRYRWNTDEKDLPLLEMDGDGRLEEAEVAGFGYPMDGFSVQILAGLRYDEYRKVYELPLASGSIDGAAREEKSIVFEREENTSTYRASGQPNLELLDNDSMKTIRTNGGSRYQFVRYPDGKFYCVLIKEASGVGLNFVYLANGCLLHTISDTLGRTITLNYSDARLVSLTQSWVEQAEGRTKTWGVGAAEPLEDDIKYSHSKNVPGNALTLRYTDEMAASDYALARTFGGLEAIAAGNGFEPAGLVGSYPFYRGDTLGDDGAIHRGHLSWSMHLYGSVDGTKESPLYVPAGFREHSAQPSPTDAVVTFYYPKLGKLTDITIAVFHVASFESVTEGARVRIGKIGGPGGSAPYYKHSHIEFYRGNCGLPKLEDRPRLRIDPSKVF